MNSPVITIVIPSLNQGCFLDRAIASVFQQEIPVEVFVLDGGSSDNSKEIIQKWDYRIAGWRSCLDDGQAAAINEGVGMGSAPFVCWLNSDDWLLPMGLANLLEAIQKNNDAAVGYGKTWNYVEATGRRKPVWVEPFTEKRLSLRCIISQPATLIRRSAWEALGGLDASLFMAFDYDLWWRIFKHGGQLFYVDDFIAVNRDHSATKTRTYRRRHYQEAIKVVRKHYGHVPIKWWLVQPYAIWFKALMRRCRLV